MVKIEFIKCDLCAESYDTHDFFKNINSDYYIVRYEFRYIHHDDEGNEYIEVSKPLYDIMTIGHYSNGGIACCLRDQNLYMMGSRCFVTGYIPIEFEDIEK